MARTYKRDSRGRFASGGSSSSGSRRGGAKLPSPTKRAATGKPQRRQGLLTQRSSLARSQAKLKGKDTADKSLTAQLSLRAQKAAVTRAKNKLAAAQKTGRIRLSGRDGVIRPRKGGKGAPTAKAVARKPKPPRDERLQRATATAQRIAGNRWKASDVAGAEFTRLRGIASRAGRRGWLAASNRADAAGARSAAAMRSAQRASRRADALIAARGAKRVAATTAKPPSRVVPRGTGRRVRMALAPNRIAGRSGQGKTLNKYNSRPQAVRGRIINGKYVKRENLRGRQPLDLSYESDRAYARTIARTAGRRQAGVVRQQQRQTTEQRRSVAEAKQKALIAPLVGTRKRGTKKQRRSIQILERAKSFYERGNNVDTLFVNVNRPGFRLPRSKRS